MSAATGASGHPSPATPDDRETGHSPAVRRIGIAVGTAVFLAVSFLPSPLHRLEGFGHRPAYAAAVAALMAILWFSEAIPIAVTACLPLLLFPALGVFGPGLGNNVVAAASPFLDAYIFMFIGGMAIGGALEHWNLHRRVALRIMSAIGTRPASLLAGMLLATAFVSMWISNTATAVMMMPVGMALVRQLEVAAGGRRLWRFGTAILLAIAYGANIGGIGTKIGTGTNSIFVGWVANNLNVDIGFVKYMAIGIPFVVLLLPIAWLVLWRFAKGDAPEDGSGSEILDRELAALGAMSRNEKKVGLVFLAAATLWMTGDLWRRVIGPLVPVFWEGYKFQGKHYEAWVAILSAFVLMLLGGLPLAALRRVPWSTLLLLGGSFAMAEGISASGLSRWMGAELAGLANLAPFSQIAIASVASVLLTAVASNTATVSVLINVLPRSLPVLTACCIASSCDFMMPAGTPPNAIVFGSGYIRLPDMMRLGFVLDLLAALLLSLYAWFYLPLLF